MEVKDVTGLGEAARAVTDLVETDVAKQMYEDAIVDPIAEASAMATDIIRGCRLFTTPFVLMGTCAARFRHYCETVRARVPQSRQVEAPSNISGPVFERLKYENNETLINAYLQLLSSAIDTHSAHLAHPAFPGILSQLSSDQAVMLLYLKRNYGRLETSDECSFDPRTNQCSRHHSRNFPFHLKQLRNPDGVYISLWHLLNLNLLDRPNYCAELNNMKAYQRTQTLWTLTDFGDAFVQACIPDSPIIGIEK